MNDHTKQVQKLINTYNELGRLLYEFVIDSRVMIDDKIYKVKGVETTSLVKIFTREKDK